VQSLSQVRVVTYDVSAGWKLTWMNVLFNRNIIAVAYQAHFCPQNSIWPISQTSRTSGCLRQNSHTTKEVYKTRPATTTVRIKPGTRPRTEYEYGKDMMAKQIYSEKSNAAVYSEVSEI
jgi:hypothetical protein